MKKFSRSFSALHGVKLPWLLIALSFVFSAAMMNAELQAATLTAGIIDTSQNAIDAKLLTNFIVVTALAALFRICEYYFTRRMEETISQRVRCKLWNKIMHLPTKYYDEDNGQRARQPCHDRCGRTRDAVFHGRVLRRVRVHGRQGLCAAV